MRQKHCWKYFAISFARLAEIIRQVETHDLLYLTIRLSMSVMAQSDMHG